MEHASELYCSICASHYDDGEHKPLLLPKCGHTFCAICISTLYRQNTFTCPECRKINAIALVDTLPVNYACLSMALAAQDNANPNNERPDTNQITTNQSNGSQRITAQALPSQIRPNQGVACRNNTSISRETCQTVLNLTGRSSLTLCRESRRIEASKQALDMQLAIALSLGDLQPGQTREQQPTLSGEPGQTNCEGCVPMCQEHWLHYLRARKKKILQVTFPREGNNPKELTVTRGEYLELLDSSRKWWEVRNVRSQVGYVPLTIVAEDD